MTANGNTSGGGSERGDVDEGARLHLLLHGARDIDTVIPVLARAANAILVAGNALRSMANDLTGISGDTARAISDTVEIKRHLKAITEREQVLRRELSAVQSKLSKRDKPARRKTPKKRRRPHG